MWDLIPDLVCFWEAVREVRENLYSCEKTSGIGQPGHINQYDFHNYKRDPAASIETHEYAQSLEKSEGIWEESGTSMGDLTGQSVQLLQGKRLLDGHLEDRNPSSICIEYWEYMAPIKKKQHRRLLHKRRNPSKEDSQTIRFEELKR